MVFSMCFPKAGINSLQRSTSEERKRNADIDKLLRKDKKIQARKVKILLLGKRSSSKFAPIPTD